MIDNLRKHSAVADLGFPANCRCGYLLDILCADVQPVILLCSQKTTLFGPFKRGQEFSPFVHWTVHDFTTTTKKLANDPYILDSLG